MMIPPQVIMVPAFKIMGTLGLINTYFSVILTYFAWVPFAIFFFRAYFSGIPRELSEAARIDGASEFRIFVGIMLPLARPAFATVGIVYFIWIFNDFMWPLIYLNDQTLRTVTLGLMNFQGAFHPRAAASRERRITGAQSRLHLRRMVGDADADQHRRSAGGRRRSGSDRLASPCRRERSHHLARARPAGGGDRRDRGCLACLVQS
jgi:hypothetical protein